MHPCRAMSSDEASSAEGYSSREASPPADADDTDQSDCSRPTSAVGEAIKQYNKMFGSDSEDNVNDEGSDDGTGNDGDGSGSGSGGGSAGSRSLPAAAHRVFRQWRKENPSGAGLPDSDEIAQMAEDATNECGQKISEQQVRTHFNNLYAPGERVWYEWHQPKAMPALLRPVLVRIIS